jgi:heat shock protein HslJ/uncharacterized lipoprotein YbaY
MPGPKLFAPLTTALAGALLLAACAVPSGAPDDRLIVSGSLTYRERIALPPDAMAVTELREGSDGAVLAESRQPLGGRQVPIPFELTLPRQALGPGAHAVRGAIFVGGRPAWVSEPKFIAAGAATIDVGALLLARYEPLAFASDLRCGDRFARFGIGKRNGKDVPQLDAGGRRYDLKEVVSASGAKYEAIDDPRTTVWTKGDRATVVVAGETWPECTLEAAGPRPFRARGNEPFWSLEASDRGLRFATPDGKLQGPAPALQSSAGIRRYTGTLQGKPVTVTVTPGVCSDTMTGMPHPARVEVEFDGRTLRGCGGEPVQLLLGEWIVTDIGGAKPVDGSRASLAFGEEGRLSGNGSCNRYTASFKLTGEALTVGKAASTMMACEPKLMEQEKRFLDILQQVQRFEIGAAGELVLIDPSGKKITARRG